MRDYYKILGVKENASEEEIRARWVELTKQHHPDRLEDASSDQRIREINEAYQVLKHSSTRVEYDLKRTYGKEARNKTAQFKRWGISAGVLMIFIIIGVIYVINHQSLLPPASVVSNGSKAGFTHSGLPASTNQKDQIDQGNGIDQRNQIDEINQTNHKSHQSVATHGPVPASRHQHNIASKHKPMSASTQTTSTHKHIAASAPPESAPTHQHINSSTDQRDNAPAPIASTPQRTEVSTNSPIIASSQSASTHPGINSSKPTAARNVEIAADESRRQAELTNAAEKQALVDSKTSRSEAAIPNLPSALGTEDEVRKFFSNYVERYNRMDLDGLFSLFSSEAVQNKKDGIQNIRKIYTNFFNQGREVRYRVQDMRIEIYQNAVEVKARYEIDQILRMGERMVWKGNVQWVLGKENGILKIRSLDYQHQQIY